MTTYISLIAFFLIGVALLVRQERRVQLTIVTSILKRTPDIDGQTLRYTMREFGLRMDSARFDAMMSRIEDKGIVRGENNRHSIRHYRLK